MTDTTIHAAMVAAHAQLTNPAKDGKANYGAYTTLAGILDHVRPILAAHGLFIQQTVANDDTHVRVSTSILHTSGDTLDCDTLTWPMVDKVQVFGGLITYLRRYALTAALGLSGADDDDDGQAANTAATRPARRGGRPQRPPSPKARQFLNDLIDKTGAMQNPDKWQASARAILGGMAEGWDGDPDTLDADQTGHLIAAMQKYEAERVTRTRHTPTDQPQADEWSTPPLDGVTA